MITAVTPLVRNSMLCDEGLRGSLPTVAGIDSTSEVSSVQGEGQDDAQAEQNRAGSISGLQKILRSHELLSPEQELRYTRQLCDEKKRLEGLLFRNPAVIRRAIHALRQVERGEVRANDVVTLDTYEGKPGGNGYRADALVALHLATVRKLFDRVNNLIAVLTDPRASESVKERTQREFNARQGRILTLLTELRFRRSEMVGFLDTLTESINNPDDQQLSAGEYVEVFWESRRQASSRLAQVKQHAALYDEAWQKLMLANTRLVFKEAWRRTKFCSSIEDIFQAGCLGLSTAIDKFDPTRGFKLSTYASCWISRYVEEYAQNHADPIVRNAHALELSRRVATAIDDFAGKYGREPSDGEIAEQLGMKRHKVLGIRQLLAPTKSLDEDYNSGSFSQTTRPADRLVALGEDVPSQVDRRIELERLREALRGLPYRERICVGARHNLLSDAERAAIKKSCGITLGAEASLNDLAAVFNVSIQRISVIYHQGVALVTERLQGKTGKTRGLGVSSD